MAARNRFIQRLEKAALQDRAWTSLELHFNEKWGLNYRPGFETHRDHIWKAGWFICTDFETTFRKRHLATIKCFDCKDELTADEVVLGYIFPWISGQFSNGGVYGLCLDCSLKPVLIKMPKTIAEAHLYQQDVQNELRPIEQETINVDQEIEKRRKELQQKKLKIDGLLARQQEAEELEKTIVALIDQKKMAEQRQDIVRLKEELEKLINPMKQAKKEIDDMNDHVQTIFETFQYSITSLESTYDKLVDTSDDIKSNLCKVTCSICTFGSDEPVALIPCGHVFCKKCSTLIKTCPKCIKKIQSTIKIFFD